MYMKHLIFEITYLTLYTTCRQAAVHCIFKVNIHPIHDYI